MYKSKSKNNKKKTMTQLDTYSDTLLLVLDNFFVFVSVLTTHPLYVAYFLYFSRYLLPLVSFLLPLLLSTSLFLPLLLLFLDRHDAADPSSTLLDYIAYLFEWESEASANDDSDEQFFECSEEEPLPPPPPVGESARHKMPMVLTESPSMRREKEWKRTLACKLYEERMTFRLCEDRTVVEGAEEMDLLWEAYEAHSSTNDDKSKKQQHKEEEEEEEDEDEDEGPVQLCCLQALRLSTGKMNFGVKRPNLEKISKAFRGIGFFHRSGRRSRKG